VSAPVLLIAIGNESRGDDAMAPLLLRGLADWLKNKGLENQVELLEDFQLQIEHAADLAGRVLVLFMDAGMDTPEPYTFFRSFPDDGRTLFSHALDPQAVLATYLNVYKASPPPSFVLCLRGEQFELGAPLSAQARQRMKLALEFMHKLLQDASVSFWESCCT
jgi:hydrogenase maturation protease